jgi:hypothetical protein
MPPLPPGEELKLEVHHKDPHDLADSPCVRFFITSLHPTSLMIVGTPVRIPTLRRSRR